MEAWNKLTNTKRFIQDVLNDLGAEHNQDLTTVRVYTQIDKVQERLEGLNGVETQVKQGMIPFNGTYLFVKIVLSDEEYKQVVGYVENKYEEMYEKNKQIGELFNSCLELTDGNILKKLDIIQKVIPEERYTALVNYVQHYQQLWDAVEQRSLYEVSHRLGT